MKPTTRSRITTDDLVAWIRRGLEALWLLAVVLVPLSFFPRESLLSESELAYIDVPKIALLRTLVALMASLWIFEWVLHSRSSSTPFFKIGGPNSWPRMWLAELKDWLLGQPARWLTLAVVLYLGSTLISTVLSASIKVSMWGLVPGQDTYPAYTIICYLILFGVVTTHLKSMSQMIRLLAAIVGMGVLVAGYAIAQHFGGDVFGLMQIPSSGRAGSTMGNAIMAGSVLLLTASISLMAATATLQGLTNVRRFWWKVSLWTLVMTMQLLGIIYTLSRGPGISTGVAMAIFLGLMALFIGWRPFLRASLVLGLAVGLTAVVLGVSATASDCVGGSPFSPCAWQTKAVVSLPLTADAPRQEFTMTVGDIPIVLNTYTSVGRDLRGGGLSSRMDIWKTSGRIIKNRPWVSFESLRLSNLRPLIGYGPDLFKYTYLLERRPQGPGGILISNRFAHNYFIHKTVELGILGLFTILGVFAAFFLAGAYLLLRKRAHYSAVQTLVLTGLLATIAGRLLEQSVGVAAVSDLTITWILLASFASLPTIMATTQPALDSGPLSQESRRVSDSRPTTAARFGNGQMAWRWSWFLAIALVLLIGLVTWFKSVSYPWAAVEARQGVNKLLDNNLPGALASFDRAIVLAPDVTVYHNLKATLYSSYRNSDDLNREPECSHLETAGLYGNCLARKAYQSNSDGSAQRPFNSPSRRALAESALNLALVDEDASLAAEAISLFGELAELDPQAWGKWERLALAHIQVGQPAEALPYLERSIAILQDSPKADNAYLIEGMTYRALGRLDRAVRSFDKALRLNPTSAQALSNRGGIYNDLGQFQRAIKDLDVAIAYDSKLPTAYNNRGNSFGNLDQLDRAMADFDEAIRLDPTFALAYYNRALANTLLVRDSEARRDTERAVALGSDPVALSRTIEALKKTR